MTAKIPSEPTRPYAKIRPCGVCLLQPLDAGVLSEMVAGLGAVREWKLKPTLSPLPLPAACHCPFPSPPQETLLTFNTC